MVTKRVLNLCFLCVAEGVQHAALYKHIKAHLAEIAGLCFSVLRPAFFHSFREMSKVQYTDVHCSAVFPCCRPRTQCFQI